MFLRPTTRRKDGKTHRTWSVVENRRVRGGRTVQKTLLYPGEISGSEHAVWCRTIDKLKGEERLVQLSLFPQDCPRPRAGLRAIISNQKEDVNSLGGTRRNIEESKDWGDLFGRMSLNSRSIRSVRR